LLTDDSEEKEKHGFWIGFDVHVIKGEKKKWKYKNLFFYAF